MGRWLVEVNRKTGGKEDEKEGVKVDRNVCRKARERMKLGN